MASTTTHAAGGLLIAWQLRDRPVLLVGGGGVAASRLVHLTHANAHITLLAPRDGLHPDVRAAIDSGAVHVWRDDVYRESAQLQLSAERDYDMVLTAIDDADKSREICAWCRARRIPVNVADVPPECDFFFGSMVRRGPLQIMVSTGGQGPRLARILRQRIETVVPPCAAEAIDRVGHLRMLLRQAAPDAELSADRMDWMTQICEAYTLEELAALDDATAHAWITKDWPRRRVPRRGGRPPWLFDIRARDVAWALGGACVGALQAVYWYHRAVRP